MKNLYLGRRLDKLYWKIVNRIFYKDWPIDLANTEIATSYEYPENKIVLAEFDLNNKHYIVLKK